MNSQYLYLSLSCIKFKLVSLDEEARHLDRFPNINHAPPFSDHRYLKTAEVSLPSRPMPVGRRIHEIVAL
jgi:hypothetical protein